MAFRSINLFASALLLVMLISSPSYACFGPKLFVGVGQEARDEALFALITLYVQEKTGVESTRVAISGDQRPLDLLSSEKVDLVFMPANDSKNDTVFLLGSLPVLVTGPRPLDDLQFTTVLPAIKKLNHLLTEDAVVVLSRRIEAGESAVATARKFLMDKRWI